MQAQRKRWAVQAVFESFRQQRDAEGTQLSVSCNLPFKGMHQQVRLDRGRQSRASEHMSREVTPLDLSGGAAYPTPSTSRNHRLPPRDENAHGANLHFQSPFTARSESPAPLTEANNNLVHHSYDLLGNLQTVSPFQTTPRNQTASTTPPPVPPSSPMAPKKALAERPYSHRPKMFAIEAVARAAREAEAEANVWPRGEVSPAPSNNADVPLRSIEPFDNIPEGDHLRQIAELRATQANLTQQLARATRRSNILHQLGGIANADRDRAVADRNAAQAELTAAQDERDAAQGGWMNCTVKCKALFVLLMIFGLYVFYRGVLYEAEFEYIYKRSMEVLGLVYGRVKREHVVE